MTRASSLALLLALAACDGAPAGQPLVSDGSRLDVAQVMFDGATPVWALAGDVDSPGSLDPTVLSITIAARTSAPTAAAFAIEGADGRVLVRAADPEFSPNRMLRGRGLAIGLIPSATASLPLDADYLARAIDVASGAGVVTQLTVWIKRSSVPGKLPVAQELPVTVVKVGSQPGSDAAITATMGQVRALWRQAGVELNETARVALDDAAAGIVLDPALASDTPALGDLLVRSREVGGDGLCLFFVPDLTVTGGEPIWAATGGIPVPPERGTTRSGVVVSGKLVASNPGQAGRVLAHEIGHALGLFHTTEGRLINRDGAGASAVNDQLDDTPNCPTGADKGPADGTLSAAECGGADVGNLMFWAATSGSTALTGAQSEIARRSALTR